MFYNDLECYLTFQTVTEDSLTSQNAPGFDRMLWHALKQYRIFWIVPETARDQNFQFLYLQNHALKVKTGTFFMDGGLCLNSFMMYISTHCKLTFIIINLHINENA